MSLIGCASSKFADVKLADRPDSYIVSKEGSDSLAVRDALIEHALDFCREKNLFMAPIDRNYNASFYALTFRCLSAGDPELDSTDELYKKEWRHKNFGGYGQISY
jgi:hypothetical protein